MSAAASAPAIRLLIAYTTAGAGHRRAAEALAQAAEGLPGIEVECVDVLAFVPPWFGQGYPSTYLFLIRRLPRLWRIGYRMLDTAAVYRAVQPLRRAWNAWAARAFARHVQARNPDCVMVTHFLPSDVCNSMKRSGALHAPLVVVVTDLHPHRLWLTPRAEAMVTAVPQSAEALEARGVASSRIRVLGIPVAPGFAERPDPVQARQALGLQPDRLTVLVTSGGTTVGRFEETVESLIALEQTFPGRLQLVVVCGQDGWARRRLEVRASGTSMPVRLHGFVETMAQLMGVSDVIVSKAGGLTVSEALACGKPLVLYHVVPGQEELNASYVAQHGAGVIAQRPGEAAAAVAACLSDPERLPRMRRAVEALSRPHAARDIIEQVVRPLLTKAGQPR